MTQKSLARWLKSIIFLVGICGAIVYFAVLPILGKSIVFESPEWSRAYWPWLLFLWSTGIPCYTALILGWKVAVNISRDTSFCMENAKYMKWISNLAASDSIWVFVGNLFLLLLNWNHPAVVLLSLLIVAFGIAVAVASAVLSHLIQKAAQLQTEADFTI